MEANIQVSEAPPRIHIPPALQSRLGLAPGMLLRVEKDENGGVMLEVETDGAVLVDEGGVLVAHGEAVGDLDAAIREERSRRIAAIIDRIGT